MVVTEQAVRLRFHRTLGRWSGVTVARPVGRKNRGGKAPAAYFRGSFSRTTNTAPKNYDCDENDCAPFAPGSPTQPTGRADRGTKERGRLCLCGGAPEEAGTSMAIAGRGGNDEGAKHDAL